jgi:ABC-type polar amino acid transport system ATPase subunit
MTAQASSLNPAPAAILRLEGVAKSFGRTKVLAEVSLDVRQGDVLCIIGPSGAGKSTLLRCINHLETIDAGTILFEGVPVYRYVQNGRTIVDPDRRVEQIRAQIGMVFQSFNLFPHLDVIGNITEAPVHVKGVPVAHAREEATVLLQKVGLADKAGFFPHQLSGGQQQRVAIARALAMNPKVMLFDEVTSALDPELIGEVLRIMRKLASDGMTMVVVTHEMEFAREVADRIAVMVDGAILDIGTPREIFSEQAHPRTRQFLRSILDRSGRPEAAVSPSSLPVLKRALP